MIKTLSQLRDELDEKIEKLGGDADCLSVLITTEDVKITEDNVTYRFSDDIVKKVLEELVPVMIKEVLNKLLKNNHY